MPNNITARPTTDFARENLFNVLENIVEIDGSRCLDLFAGTGAISLEFISREAASVTLVEKASTQVNFIKKVADILGLGAEFTVIRGDVFKFLERVDSSYDIIFADPPYDMPGFAEVPEKIFSSRAVSPGTLVVVEHNCAHDFATLPGFMERRVYGSVNFSIFRVPQINS